jgi:hypothetical protein
MLDKKLSSRRILIAGLVSAGFLLSAARPTWAQG